MNKKIIFIFNGRFPSEKADSLFAALDAKSFVDEGADLVMLVPDRKRLSDDPFVFYNLHQKFSIKYLPIVDLFNTKIPKVIVFWTGLISFSLSCLFYIFLYKSDNVIIYSNEIVPIFIASIFGFKTFYEMHDYPESKKNIFGFIIRKIDKVLIHNRWKTEKAITEFALNRDKVITLLNAVSVEDFDLDMTREEARKILGLPFDKKIIVYTGHLYSWKGADLLAKTAQFMPNVDFYFIGGNTKDVDRFKNNFTSKNLHFLGFRSHKEIPLWQKSADCLVLPNTAKEDISKYYTSPMKLFEYMASGVPIVASNIPSIVEIVSTNEVVFFEPDNLDSIREKIDFTLNKSNSEYISKLVNCARKKVENYSWKIRARKILDFIYE